MHPHPLFASYIAPTRPLSFPLPTRPTVAKPAFAASQVEIFDISRNNEYTRFIFYPTNKQASVWPVP